MKIAFTSCMSAQICPVQPVWDAIAEANPDVLVLLGDSIYLDVGGQYNTGGIKDLGMTPDEFAAHAHDRYKEQLAQWQFKALVQQTHLCTYAIWDDHDFLWNNACGADVAQSPNWRDLVAASRSQFLAYREALRLRLEQNSFPAAPVSHHPTPPAPGYSTVKLANNVVLHLTDGRSFKSGNGHAALLGNEQMNALEAELQAAPNSLHVIASGVVFENRGGEQWAKCNTEHAHLLALAHDYSIILLSGDIHHNRLASYDTAANHNRKLYEATASGAALPITMRPIGHQTDNKWGLLEISEVRVSVRTFAGGLAEQSATLDRARWQSLDWKAA